MAHTSPDPSQDLTVQFVGELFRHTADLPTEDAYREALQAFCDALLPWVAPREAPSNPSGVFTLFEDFHLGAEETVSISFTPEGVAFFRAWLRQRGIDPT